MPTDLIQLLTNATQPAIFATLFIYLFLKSREDAAKILLVTRTDAENREEKQRQDAAERERWYRDYVAKQGQIFEAQGVTLKHLADQVERIERRLEGKT